MPDIQQRIADILNGQDVIAPTLADHPNQVLSYMSAAELAEVLVSELGLTPEQRQMQNTGLLARLGIERFESRYVTKWVPDA
jgi:hypothetical protein